MKKNKLEFIHKYQQANKTLRPVSNRKKRILQGFAVFAMFYSFYYFNVGLNNTQTELINYEEKPVFVY